MTTVLPARDATYRRRSDGAIARVMFHTRSVVRVEFEGGRRYWEPMATFWATFVHSDLYNPTRNRGAQP
jgi:hypothetical protein